jgi:2-methylaconitate cis-trans-isomerase PrpF
MDMATPVVIIPAEYLGKTGYESAQDLDADRELLARIESIRLQAGEAMGLGNVSNKVILNLFSSRHLSTMAQLMFAILCRILAIKHWQLLGR